MYVKPRFCLVVKCTLRVDPHSGRGWTWLSGGWREGKASKTLNASNFHKIFCRRPQVIHPHPAGPKGHGGAPLIQTYYRLQQTVKAIDKPAASAMPRCLAPLCTYNFLRAYHSFRVFVLFYQQQETGGFE